MYYHAQKPLNPRLKKPRYKPTPNYDFIRSGFPEKSPKNNEDSLLSMIKDSKDRSEEMSQMLEGLNMKDKIIYDKEESINKPFSEVSMDSCFRKPFQNDSQKTFDFNINSLMNM
jgi:hypothetical protein